MSKPLLLKMFHEPAAASPGACWNLWISGPVLELLNQNQHFGNISRWFLDVGVWEGLLHVGKMLSSRREEQKENFKFRLNCNGVQTKSTDEQVAPLFGLAKISSCIDCIMRLLLTFVSIPVATDKLSEGSWIKLSILNRFHSLSRECGWHMLMCFICVHPNMMGCDSCNNFLSGVLKPCLDSLGPQPLDQMEYDFFFFGKPI